MRVRMHNNSCEQLGWHVLSSSRIVCRNWHQTGGFAVWLPGFRRAGPSTPLDKSVCRFDCSMDYRIFRSKCQVRYCHRYEERAMAGFWAGEDLSPNDIELARRSAE